MPASFSLMAEHSPEKPQPMMMTSGVFGLAARAAASAARRCV